jgi:hypothetical protein
MAQVVVNYNKRFNNVFVGLPRSVNDSRVLHIFFQYKDVQCHGLYEDGRSYHGFFLFLLSDKGHSLIYWIMTPFKERRATYCFSIVVQWEVQKR